MTPVKPCVGGDAYSHTAHGADPAKGKAQSYTRKTGFRHVRHLQSQADGEARTHVFLYMNKRETVFGSLAALASVNTYSGQSLGLMEISCHFLYFYFLNNNKIYNLFLKKTINKKYISLRQHFVLAWLSLYH
jgi:hypothetical protein